MTPDEILAWAGWPKTTVLPPRVIKGMANMPVPCTAGQEIGTFIAYLHFMGVNAVPQDGGRDQDIRYRRGSVRIEE